MRFQAEERDVGELSLALARAGVGILALTPELATLEDLFFRLTEGDGAAHRATGPDGRLGGDRRPRRRDTGAGSAGQKAVEIG